MWPIVIVASGIITGQNLYKTNMLTDKKGADIEADKDVD